MSAHPDDPFMTAVLVVTHQTLLTGRLVKEVVEEYAAGCNHARIPPAALTRCAVEALRLTMTHCPPEEPLRVFADYAGVCLLYSRDLGPQDRPLTERTLHRLTIAYDCYRRVSRALLAPPS